MHRTKIRWLWMVLARTFPKRGGEINMRVIATGVAAVLVLAGCYGPTPTYSSYSGGGSNYARPDTAPSSPSIKEDAYNPSIEVETDIGERKSPGGGTEIYGLYAKIDRASGVVVTYVQWSTIYTSSEWLFFSRASSSQGKAYDFRQVNRKVSSCSRYSGCVYTETYNIYIPAQDMRTGAKSGISFKIYGKTGAERVIDLSADLVAAFNSKVDEATKGRKK